MVRFLACWVTHAESGWRVQPAMWTRIETPLLRQPESAEIVASVKALHPIGRLGQPEEVAALVTFLASEQASFVSGSYYTVDGAYTAQ